MGRIIKKYRFLLSGKQQRHVVILFIMMILGAFLEVLGISMMIPLISAILNKNIIEENEYIAQVCKVLQIDSYRNFALACIGFIVAVYVIKTCYLVLQYYLQYCFVSNGQFLMQSRLLSSYVYRPYEFFLKIESGEVIRIIQSDTLNAFQLLSILLGMLSDGIVALALTVTVLIINPLVTAFSAIMMLMLVFLIVKAVRPKLRRQGTIYQKSCAASNKWLLQSITGVKEMKVTGTEDYFIQNYKEYGKKQSNANRVNNTLQATPRLFIEGGCIISVLIIIGIMLYIDYDVEMLIPSLSAFAMAAIKLLPNINRIVAATNQISFLEPALDSIIKTLKEFQNESVEESVCIKEISVQRDIELHNITFHYPDSNKLILNHANMKIQVGHSVGIIGPSGAGKTTAVDIILGLLKPQEGQILVDGENVLENKEAWLKHVGYIPQTIFMLDATIRENIIFGNDVENDEVRLWNALEDAQLADFVRSLPDGLETAIGERGVRLSGGQRQRIGIARALYRNPDVLIFDEATSALDNDTEEAIMEAINALHGKKTMIIIAHRLSTIRDCDSVFQVEDGKIMDKGATV